MTVGFFWIVWFLLDRRGYCCQNSKETTVFLAKSDASVARRVCMVRLWVQRYSFRADADILFAVFEIQFFFCAGESPGMAGSEHVEPGDPRAVSQQLQGSCSSGADGCAF